jgi:hypothetical protein
MLVFPEAKVSAPFQLVMFAVAGIGGYLYMGNKVGYSQTSGFPEPFTARLSQ